MGLSIILQSFSSLYTVLGQNSPFIGELAKRRNIGLVRERLRTFTKILYGEEPSGKLMSYKEITPVSRSINAIPVGTDLTGTLFDEKHRSDPFTLLIPFPITLDTAKGKVTFCGIYIPYGTRELKLHSTGQAYIAPNISTRINNLIATCQAYDEQLKLEYESRTVNKREVFISVIRLLNLMANELTGKNGLISRNLYGLRYEKYGRGKSVPYNCRKPYSIKIHYSIADACGVSSQSVDSTRCYVMLTRYPDLSFASWVPAVVNEISYDDADEAVIYLSRNDFKCTNDDHDGDVVYIAGPPTRKCANEFKQRYLKHVNQEDTVGFLCHLLNERCKFHDDISTVDYGEISPREFTVDERIDALRGNIGVKMYTGVTVSLLYSLSRIVESVYWDTDLEEWKAIFEECVRQVAQESIGAKHGLVPSYERFRRALNRIDTDDARLELLDIGIHPDAVAIMEHALIAKCKELFKCYPSELDDSMQNDPDYDTYNLPSAIIDSGKYASYRIGREVMLAGRLLENLFVVRNDDPTIASKLWKAVGI